MMTAYNNAKEVIEGCISMYGYNDVSTEELNQFIAGKWLAPDFEDSLNNKRARPDAVASILPAFEKYLDERDGYTEVDPSDLAELLEADQASPDVLEEYVIEHWEGPALPFVFFSLAGDELYLCATDYKQVVSDLMKWAFPNDYIEFELGYVQKKTDEYLNDLFDDNATSYSTFILSYPDDAFTWFDCDTEEYDFEVDTFCFKGTNERFTRDSMPVEYMVENAFNTVLNEGDCLARVVRVPTREEVVNRFEQLPPIQADYLDFPYCLSSNWISLLEPERVEDVDDLVSFIAVELLESSTQALIQEALDVEDPVEYVAYQLALALQQRALMKMPVISLDGIASGLFNMIANAGKKQKVKTKRRKPATMREKVFDAMMGRK